MAHRRPVRTLSPMITRICISLAVGWLVGTDVAAWAGWGAGEAVCSKVGPPGTTVGDTVVDDKGADVDADAQAVIKIDAKISTIS